MFTMSNSAAYAISSLVDPRMRDASHACTSSGRYLTLRNIFRNLGPRPLTRSRSTVLTDSFKNSAASSWVSSGCIVARKAQMATGDHDKLNGIIVALPKASNAAVCAISSLPAARSARSRRTLRRSLETHRRTACYQRCHNRTGAR